MNRTGFFSDEACFWHISQPHVGILPVGGWVQPSASSSLPESPDSKRRLKSLLDMSGLLGKLTSLSAPSAGEEALLRIHGSAYLEKFRRVSEAGGGVMGPEASCGKGSYDYARKSTGLVMCAVDMVLSGDLDNAYALSRPPGHHCLPDEGMGFCFLANIPVAIEEARRVHKLSRVAVVDWDVHHGNGTEAIFYDRPDVLTISIHQENCYPTGSGHPDRRGDGAGEGYNINIPLLPGGGHDAYVGAMEKIVVPALKAYQPELIIVACGYDANAFDPLARMMLPSQTYRYLISRVMDVAGEVCGGKVVAAHEGGYSEAYVPFCGHALIETLAGCTTAVRDEIEAYILAQQPGPRFIAFQNELLDELADMFGFPG
ncbi:class II histone deacetylase [Komagataeibacter europaeus]|uniref:class II histone deacetylase n=1 Tax=Komagataeibacter europaeus TaxID=33995 RepID=UPI000B3EB88B|nr:class II histone deacetylase [Komagataeibacter europaeus]ARW17237.1 Histone deacetylase [Komagataeibacter europaeus]